MGRMVCPMPQASVWWDFFDKGVELKCTLLNGLRKAKATINVLWVHAEGHAAALLSPRRQDQVCGRKFVLACFSLHGLVVFLFLLADYVVVGTELEDTFMIQLCNGN